jgi:hypothetical protein
VTQKFVFRSVAFAALAVVRLQAAVNRSVKG